MVVLPKVTQCNPYQKPNGTFCKARKIHPKIRKGPQTAKTVLKIFKNFFLISKHITKQQ
jgi:hypothetical protein